MNIIYRAFITTLLLAIASGAWADPILHIEHPVHDFGSLTQGRKLDHVFILANRGDVPLTIKKVSPACGCTAANLATPNIQPGKRTELKVSFDSTNFAGPVNKTITIESTDPQTPSMTLTLKGTIVEEVAVQPRQLNLGKIPASASKVVTFQVENKGNRSLRIIEVKSQLPQVSGQTDRNLLKPGESATVSVSIVPRADDRFITGYLTVATDHPSRPTIMVPIYASIGQ